MLPIPLEVIFADPGTILVPVPVAFAIADWGNCGTMCPKKLTGDRKARKLDVY